MSRADGRRCGRCGAELRCTNPNELCDPCRRRADDDCGLRLPADFYQRTTVTHSLTAYDFGAFFRITRTALDLTQEELGLLIGLAQSQVCKIEKGTLPLRDVETVARMARTFSIPTDLLGFPVPRADAASTNQNRGMVSATTVRCNVPANAPVAALGDKTAVSSCHRVGGHVLREGLHPSAEGDEHVEKAVLLASVRLLTELDDDEPPANVRVGPVDVERLRQHVALFELVVWRIGGAELRHLVTRYIVVVSRLVRGRACEPAVRVQLNRILAELHRMAGWMHLHAEDHAAARQHWDAGVRAADRGRDGSLVARILDGRSQQLCQLGRYDHAFTMIRRARGIADGVATPTVMAMLVGRAEAWICAERGWHEEALAAIGSAQEAYGNARPAENPPWAQWFDEAQLLSAEGHCLMILAHRGNGNAHRAVDLITRSVAMMPPRAEHSRMLNLPGLASALVLAGELDEAARVFRCGMTAAATADSSEARTRLRRDFRRFAASCASQHRELGEVGQELDVL